MDDERLQPHDEGFEQNHEQNQQTVAGAPINCPTAAGAFDLGPGPIMPYTDYTGHHMRIECVRMALEYRQVGAPPLTDDELMARAKRFWSFVENKGDPEGTSTGS